MEDVMGTKLAGYAPPSKGPFLCANCEYFKAVAGDKGNCHNKHVLADPEVPKVQGLAVVAAGGCCTYFETQ